MNTADIENDAVNSSAKSSYVCVHRSYTSPNVKDVYIVHCMFFMDMNESQCSKKNFRFHMPETPKKAK